MNDGAIKKKKILITFGHRIIWGFRLANKKLLYRDI